jgi:hypothetical protein
MVCGNNEQADTAGELGKGVAIKAYIKTWNKSSKKFMWTKQADDILVKINKAKSILSNV